MRIFFLSRLLHARPSARNARFMAVFRRTRIGFRFRTVGVDAHIDPPKAPILWRFSGEPVLIFVFAPLGRTTLSARRKRPFLRKSDANSQHFNGPMWASAPTNNRAKLHDFVGRTESSAPTKGVENHACPAKIAAFPVSCRRGRCPHRPTESTYFMAAFRRTRVDFRFRTVGADDSVRPRKMPAFTEIRCEIATF